MGYRPFHMSRIGASHISRQMPCQDASASEAYRDAYIAVVADGHGSRRHFRSERGSAIACQVALEYIRAFLDDGAWDEDTLDGRLNELKQNICQAWDAAVRADYESEPWTQAELEEERALLSEEQFAALTDGSGATVAYGTTLCAAFLCDAGWAAIQLGDGCFVRVGPEGAYDWLMPESMVNEGNRTASLCMREPMRDFRHCWGTDRPSALLVFTDGIEKTFPSQGREVMSLLHWIWRNACTDGPGQEDNLARTLDMLTQRSSIGDDVSVAGIVDTAAEDAEPRSGARQQQRELARLEARLSEMLSTIQFNEQRLAAARRNEKDVRSGAVEQLQDVIERKRAAAGELLDGVNALRAALGLPPAEPLPEPEPEPEPLPEPEQCQEQIPQAEELPPAETEQETAPMPEAETDFGWDEMPEELDGGPDERPAGDPEGESAEPDAQDPAEKDPVEAVIEAARDAMRRLFKRRTNDEPNGEEIKK